MMYQHMERFNKIAIERELSAGAILLWQQLYTMMARKENFSDVKICTAVLLSLLDVTRNGFQKARKALVDVGVLGIRQEGSETFYTLELVNFAQSGVVSKSAFSDNSNMVWDDVLDVPLAQRANVEKSFPWDKKNQDLSTALEMTCREDLSTALEMTYRDDIRLYDKISGDIIHNNRYEQPMREFTAMHNNGELHGVLRQWVEMRKENGWELSMWGLQELLKKLATLANGDIKTMIATVRQSIARRWKGFHPLRKECKPSGEKLRQEEQRAEWMDTQRSRNSKTTQKFRNEGRDLSFLEQ